MQQIMRACVLAHVQERLSSARPALETIPVRIRANRNHRYFFPLCPHLSLHSVVHVCADDTHEAFAAAGAGAGAASPSGSSSASRSFCSAHHRPACKIRTPVRAMETTRWEDARESVGSRSSAGNLPEWTAVGGGTGRGAKCSVISAWREERRVRGGMRGE
jgi:hypothetical protein